MKLNKTVLSLLLVALAFTQGGNKIGTGGASQLLIPMSARNISLAGSNASTASGLDAVQINPAGLSTKGSSEFKVTQMNYIADIDLNAISMALSISESSSIAVWGRSLSVGEIEVTTLSDPNGNGQTYEPTLFVGGFTYSSRLTDRINFGLSAKYYMEKIQRSDASGMAFDFGVQYLHESGISMGVSLKNIGPDMQFRGDALNVKSKPNGQNNQDLDVTTQLLAQKVSLPVIFDISLGYKYELDSETSTNLYTKYSNNDKSEKLLTGGLELQYDDMFFVRGGYESYMENQENYIFGAAFGIGVQMSSFSVDYGYRQAEFFDGNHVFTIGLAF